MAAQNPQILRRSATGTIREVDTSRERSDRNENPDQDPVEDEESFFLDDNEIHEALSTIDFDYIFKRVLDMFCIDYYDVDCDSDLIMRKFEYVFIIMPHESEEKKEEQKRIVTELDCLKIANGNMMEYIKDPMNKFPEMERSPLKSRTMKFGIPPEFFQLLEEAKHHLLEQASSNFDQSNLMLETNQSALKNTRE